MSLPGRKLEVCRCVSQCQLILRKRLIARRRSAHVLKYPDAKVISLGIGDTTEPIPEVITFAMAMRVHSLATFEGYSVMALNKGIR